MRIALRSGMREINSEQRCERFAIKYGESFNRAINGGATDAAMRIRLAAIFTTPILPKVNK